jgi:hypothetical protein
VGRRTSDQTPKMFRGRRAVLAEPETESANKKEEAGNRILNPGFNMTIGRLCVGTEGKPHAEKEVCR